MADKGEILDHGPKQSLSSYQKEPPNITNIPAEIRLKIYEELFLEATYPLQSAKGCKHHPLSNDGSHHILQACRLLRDEALTSWYGFVTFNGCVQCTQAWRSCASLKILPPAHLCKRHIIARVVFEDVPRADGQDVLWVASAFPRLRHFTLNQRPFYCAAVGGLPIAKECTIDRLLKPHSTPARALSNLLPCREDLIKLRMDVLIEVGKERGFSVMLNGRWLYTSFLILAPDRKLLFDYRLEMCHMQAQIKLNGELFDVPQRQASDMRQS